MKCWKDHCEHKLEFICPCESPPIYSCDLHINAHLKIKDKSAHHPEAIIFSPNPETKEALIDYLHQSLSDLYEFRRKTVHDFSIQINQINDKMKTTLKSVDQAIKKQKKIISQINLAESISHLTKTKLDEILALEPKESVEMLKDCFGVFDKSHSFIDDNGKLIKSETFLNESNRFAIFRDNATKIVQTDLNNFSSTEFNLSLDSLKSPYITMCMIPENSIFCYGNYPTLTNEAFIIEWNNNVKNVINAPFSLSTSGSIYYKNIVYIFGGWAGGAHVDNAVVFFMHIFLKLWKIKDNLFKVLPLLNLKMQLTL